MPRFHLFFHRDCSRPLFRDDGDRMWLLRHMARRGESQGVRVLAFSFPADSGQLLVEGPEAELSEWGRTSLSAYGSWRRARNSPVSCRTTARSPLGDSEVVLVDRAANLHGPSGGLDPLSRSDSSLWDVLGLRALPFFDPTPLREAATPDKHLRLSGSVYLPFDLEALALAPALRAETWALVEEAWRAATGQGPEERGAKVPLVQLAAWAGWSRDALCVARGVEDPAVRKALRAPFPPGFLQAVAHLQHPALRHALYRKISG
ncbi:hypothetical protein L6R49_00445 [Myxococcota bacterium]|nr:hypothetical protein [Myxococcota bacterium]